MTVHITTKVKTKIHFTEFDPIPVSTPEFLESWYVNCFVLGGKRYFIFTESLTLFSTILSSNQVNDVKVFYRLATDVLFEHFKSNRKLPLNIFEKVADRVILCKTANRRILGSQNELIWLAQAGFAYNGKEDFHKLNDTPLSMLEYSPRDAFDKRIKALIES